MTAKMCGKLSWGTLKSCIPDGSQGNPNAIAILTQPQIKLIFGGVDFVGHQYSRIINISSLNKKIASK